MESDEIDRYAVKLVQMVDFLITSVTFKAHRLILAACSKHFQELFEGMPPSPAGLIVILDGTSAHNMTSLLEFMYRGEVHVSQESLSSFLKAAEYLQLSMLIAEYTSMIGVIDCHFQETSPSPIVINLVILSKIFCQYPTFNMNVLGASEISITDDDCRIS
ncbi:hypothetical protein PV326_008847 [Microctonus aethiopoides]|nr:hypothetical protein PV326_008847 [Microctonus aethiopoides]